MIELIQKRVRGRSRRQGPDPEGHPRAWSRAWTRTPPCCRPTPTRTCRSTPRASSPASASTSRCMNGFVDGHLADRGHPGAQGRHRGRRPHHQGGRATLTKRPARGRPHDARPRGSKVTVTIMRKGIKKPLEFEHHPRRDPDPERQIHHPQTRLRVRAHLQLHGHDHPGLRKGARKARDRADPHEGAGARPAQQRRRAAQPGDQRLRRVPGQRARSCRSKGRDKKNTKVFNAHPLGRQAQLPARGADQRRHGQRLARSWPARCRTTSGRVVIGHHVLRQGLGADGGEPARRLGPQADHRALLHPERPLHPGQGHRARHHAQVQAPRRRRREDPAEKDEIGLQGEGPGEPPGGRGRAGRKAEQPKKTEKTDKGKTSGSRMPSRRVGPLKLESLQNRQPGDAGAGDPHRARRAQERRADRPDRRATAPVCPGQHSPQR
ncbi:MAG: hypothetical protein MZV70_21925 [Desulfobacterales bacterium]|nr:hypothetical protein [Desulfobacterales bacterium]